MLRPILPGLLPSPVPERRRHDPDWRDERWEDEQSVAATTGSVRVASGGWMRVSTVQMHREDSHACRPRAERARGREWRTFTPPDISPEPLPLPRKSPSRTFAL